MAHHPSDPSFEFVDLTKAECQYCNSPVYERMRVPQTIHPDEQVFVCDEHASFIHDVGTFIEDLTNPDPF